MAEPPRLTSRRAAVFPELPRGEERARYVRENFDRIARSYDLFNDLATLGMHRLWKRRTVRESGVRGTGARVLDLCCGTGDLAFLFSAALAKDGHVTALDFSPGMLAHLGRRLSARSGSGAPVVVTEGDALHLSFPDDSFRVVCIGFGLRNVQDRAAALREMFRVLEPGGRALILDVGRPRLRLLQVLHQFYFERIVPRIGALLDKDNPGMYAYLPASAREYPEPEELSRELLETGFVGTRTVRFLFGASTLVIADKPESESSKIG